MESNNKVEELLPVKTLLFEYMDGFFPMAYSYDGGIYWHSPDPRAIIPFQNIKMPRSVRQLMTRKVFNFTINANFEFVIRRCAARENTWISDSIINSYIAFHKAGYAHSVEAWQNGEIVGGLYGVAIKGAFFGESMFSLVSNSSKAAYYFLIEHLKNRGYQLLDSQYLNEHTESLGAIEIPKYIYRRKLYKAMQIDCNFEP